MRRIRLYACSLSIISLSLFLPACHREVRLPPGVIPPPGRAPSVRVRVLNQVEKVSLRAPSSGLLLTDALTGERVASLKPGERWEAVRFGEQKELRVATPDGRVSRPHSGGVRAVTFGGEKVIEVGGKAYRGEVLIYSTPEGRLIAVNRLSLEDYLRSVVPAEMGAIERAGIEALKAQAVAARSYALTLVARNQSFHFDLTADTGDQVYRGLTGENPDADEAVFETVGECLLKGGQPVAAFYHSCCGGITADPEEVWGRQFADANRYLQSVRDGTYDTDSKWYSWTVTWTREKLLEILKSTLPTIVGLSSAEIGEPTDMEVVEKGKSGRNQLLKVITDRRVLQVQGDAIRRALRQPDGSLLPSTMFDLAVERQGNSIAITASGRGFGHGLGLCQTGARARALDGQSYEKILDHYYHGVKLARIY